MNKPKVGIFTLTHALNYGAFYQMYAMANYFTSTGYEVTVFDCQKTLKYRLLRIFSYNPSRQIRKFVLHRQFYADRKSIRIIQYFGQRLDLAILGSDEIWNLENSSFEHAQEYIGLGVNAAKIVAYAPSIGYANKARLIANEGFRKGLLSMDGILARDEGTRRIAEEITGRRIPDVVDPTMLLDSWEGFHSAFIPPQEDYILYYGYSSSPKFKDTLIKYANTKSLRIYTAGYRVHDWCSENFSIGPSAFLALMKNAKYVFTDTFHGFVMATLLDKCLCYSAPMQKIQDIAVKLGMQNDAVDENSGQMEIEAALMRDRSERNRRIKVLRSQSQTTLQAMLEVPRDLHRASPKNV